MGLSYWSRIPGVWRACWRRGRQSSDKHGSKQVWWSAWTGQPLPGGTGCWCCCCWGRRRQSRSGSGRRPPGPPTRRPGSSVSMFSWSLSGPVGMRRDKSCTLSPSAEQESYFVIQISDRAWFDIQSCFLIGVIVHFRFMQMLFYPGLFHFSCATADMFVGTVIQRIQFLSWQIIIHEQTFASSQTQSNKGIPESSLSSVDWLSSSQASFIKKKNIYILLYLCVGLLLISKSWSEWKHLFKDIPCRVNSLAPCQKDIYWS